VQRFKGPKHEGSDSRAQNKIITNGGYRFYIHIYKVPTSHIPTSTILCHFHILPCGLAMTAKQHGRIWKWIQNNLEIYWTLEGAIYTYVSGTKNTYGAYKMKMLFTTSFLQPREKTPINPSIEETDKCYLVHGQWISAGIRR